MRLPVEQGLCERNVGAALDGIVFGQFSRLDDVRRRAGEFLHELGEFANGEFAGVAEVDRAMHVRRIIGCFHHCDDAANEIIDITERAGLFTVAIERDVITFERLADEVADDSTIVRMHARAVGVEDAHDPDVDFVLAQVIEHQCFSCAFAFVVAGARADGVDVASVAFRLGVDIGVAVDFACGRVENSRADALGEAEHVDRAHDGGLGGLDGVELVVPGRRGAGEVVDLINFKKQRVCDIVADQLEIVFVEQMIDVGLLAGEEVIHADDIVAGVDEPVAEM